MHRRAAEGHVGTALLGYSMAFFAIWWTWLNFAWFNSAYDNDDDLHRVLTLAQIFGSLVLAAGVGSMFDGDFVLVVLGYAIMRIALVLSWLRAAAGHPEGRTTALRYAGGVFVVQLYWVGILFVPESVVLGWFAVGVLLEFCVPVIAERAGETPWHPHHIAERYGLFFIIVLGETVLAATVAIQEALDADEQVGGLLYVVIGGVLIIFSMWWLYFARDSGAVLTGNNAGYLWGFGHYVVFASGALIGAGLAIRADYWTHHAELNGAASAAMVTGPVALLVASLWAIMVRPHDASVRTWGPFAGAIVALAIATLAPAPELVTGLICVVLLTVELRLTGGSGDHLDVGRSH